MKFLSLLDTRLLINTKVSNVSASIYFNESLVVFVVASNQPANCPNSSTFVTVSDDKILTSALVTFSPKANSRVEPDVRFKIWNTFS